MTDGNPCLSLLLVRGTSYGLEEHLDVPVLWTVVGFDFVWWNRNDLFYFSFSFLFTSNFRTSLLVLHSPKETPKCLSQKEEEKVPDGVERLGKYDFRDEILSCSLKTLKSVEKVVVSLFPAPPSCELEYS